MVKENLPTKAWLEQAQHYKQPFTVIRDDEMYKMTVEKVDTK